MKSLFFAIIFLFVCSVAQAEQVKVTWDYPQVAAIAQVDAVDSEELVGEDGAKGNVLDGNPDTIWHTQWQEESPPHPHWVGFDLGGNCTISGLRYLPRVSGTHGKIGRYEVLIDGVVVASSSFVSTGWQEVLFDSPVKSDNICLKALSELDGNPWTSVAEIEILATKDQQVDGYRVYWRGDQVAEVYGKAAIVNVEPPAGNFTVTAFRGSDESVHSEPCPYSPEPPAVELRAPINLQIEKTPQ